jgi:hypothetical protein
MRSHLEEEERGGTASAAAALVVLLVVVRAGESEVEPVTEISRMTTMKMMPIFVEMTVAIALMHADPRGA